MNQSRAWRTVCDAALLDDTQAKALLCENLVALEAINWESVHVANTLLAALAWLDPELARTQAEALPNALSPQELYFFSQDKMLDEFQKARLLYSGGQEAIQAHIAQLNTLPERSPAHAYQSRILYLAQLQSTPPTNPTHGISLSVPYYPYNPQSYPLLTDWQILFPVARLWRDNPVLASNTPHKIFPVAIYTLASLGRKSDTAPLVSVLCERVQQRAVIIGLEAAAIFKALDVLELHDLWTLRELIPCLIDIVAGGVGDHASILTAKILALAEKYELELTPLLQKLVERILGEKNARTARRWTRTLSWALRTLFSEAPLAYGGTQDLRILALSRTVTTGLTSKASLRPQEEPRLRRCWRWLGRSEALIASMRHEHWQADLLHRKARLENQVVRSRKARHRALIQ
jgi:hypothetical protein